MYANGANVEIHDTIFLTNSVSGSVSISTLRELSQIFALIPGGPHGTISNDHRSLNPAPIIAKPGTVGKSWHHLSFALVFSFVRAFFVKRIISNFRSNSRRRTCYLQLSLFICLEIQYAICDVTPFIVLCATRGVVSWESPSAS
jgi:hypothetical protein